MRNQSSPDDELPVSTGLFDYRDRSDQFDWRATAQVLPLPEPGDLLAAVQMEWDGIEALGAPIPSDLPRPWEPATCTASGLRAELLIWLSEFVVWLNTQHAWHPDTAIPRCWPEHPHLVHDLAVLADHRRRASNQCNSLQLEQWQRTALPAFVDRMRLAVGQHCASVHRDLGVAGLLPGASA